MRSTQPKNNPPDALRAAIRDALAREQRTEAPLIPGQREPAQADRRANGAPVDRRSGQPGRGRGGRGQQPNIARPLRRRGG